MSHKKKFVIIGIGQFGKALALLLRKHGCEVTAIDKRKDAIDGIKDRVSVAKIGDATNDALLDSLDLDENTHIIVAVGESLESALLIAAHLKIKKKVDVRNIHVRTVNMLQNEMLKLMGITDLFFVEEEAARRLAPRFMNQDFISLTSIDSTHSLAEVRLPETLVGKTLMESELRSKYHLNLITVRRGLVPSHVTSDEDTVQPEQPVIGTPEPSMVFQQGDILVLFGKESHMREFLEKFPAS